MSGSSGLATAIDESASVCFVTGRRRNNATKSTIPPQQKMLAATKPMINATAEPSGGDSSDKPYAEQFESGKVQLENGGTGIGVSDCVDEEVELDTVIMVDDEKVTEADRADVIEASVDGDAAVEPVDVAE